MDEAEENAGSDDGSFNIQEDLLREKCDEETKALRFMKVFFAVVLMSGTALAGFLIFKYASGAEEHNFQIKYEHYSEMVVRVFLDNVDRKMKTAQEMSRTITSYAKGMNMTWPMVTIPDFQLLGAIARRQSGALLIVLLPIVREPDRSNWESYSVEHQGWLDAKPVDVTGSRRLIARNGTNRQLGNIPGRIFKLDKKFLPAVDDRVGPYVPIWQTSPLPSSPIVINYDLLTHPLLGPQIQTVLLAKEPIISIAATLEANSSDPVIKELTRMVALETGKKFDKGPFSGLFYPVFNSFQSDRQMVAVLGMEIFWQEYFSNLLPPNANGTVCVLESSCGTMFTYQIMGPDVTYLGEGDLHDTQFDHLEKMEAVSGKLIHPRSHECRYTIRVYPSALLRRSFLTNRPAVLTIATVLVIAFSSLTFVIYDYATERRQSKIMRAAAGVTSIVYVLFPATVRDRIFGDHQTDAVGGSPLVSPTIEALDRHSDYVADEPIADFFPSATVLFADIVGFTDWSADRDPSQIFIVLERVFRSFDKCAKRKGVFKVETIQDSYMAVTGLPVPQAEHAVIMASFAFECMEEFNRVIPSLLPILGCDASKLTLRIGLHSGPVIAGVLRGEKSRFQLFGDTVNTAARMQTTGEAGKVHLSKDTAECLSTAGKSSWCLTREETVTVKGKGTLQTFWLDHEKHKLLGSLSIIPNHVCR